DHALPLQLQIRPLDRDHADAERHGKLADRRDLLSPRPIAHGHPLLDLLHDLEVHGPAVGLGEDEITVHTHILSIHSRRETSRGFLLLCSSRWKFRMIWVEGRLTDTASP